MKRSRRILPAVAVVAAVLIAASAAAMAAMPNSKPADKESKAIALINNELAAASIKRENGHKISAYKEAKDDGIMWRIEIANVDIGNGFDVTYFVTLNALTGEILDLDMTR